MPTEPGESCLPRQAQGRRPLLETPEAAESRAAARLRYARKKALGPRPSTALAVRAAALADSVLTVKELSEILDVCLAKNVAYLKLGELEVRLHRQSNAAESAPNPVDHATTGAEPTLSLADQQLLEEAEDAQRLIEDPLGYEQVMIDRHLRGDADLDAAAQRREAK